VTLTLDRVILHTVVHHSSTSSEVWCKLFSVKTSSDKVEALHHSSI